MDSKLIEAIEEEKVNRFNKPWIKLDKGSKLNRINLYLEKLFNEDKISDSELSKLKKNLYEICNLGNLNKINDVEYSIEECEIISIKYLIFDDNKKKYNILLPKKTNKNVSKSKSNIDRHFSRSKTNR